GVECRRIPSDRGNPRSLPRERDRDGAPDAACRAGDDDVPAAESLLHTAPSSSKSAGEKISSARGPAKRGPLAIATFFSPGSGLSFLTPITRRGKIFISG